MTLFLIQGLWIKRNDPDHRTQPWQKQQTSLQDIVPRVGEMILLDDPEVLYTVRQVYHDYGNRQIVVAVDPHETPPRHLRDRS